MRLTTWGSVTNPRMRVWPPQRGHTSTSTVNTHRSSSAQRRRRAWSAGPTRLGLHRAGRNAFRARQHHAARSPPHPPPRGVRPRVPHPHLVALRHVVHPARQELERRHPVDPGVGAVGAVRHKLHLGPLGVVTQARLRDRRASRVARHPQQPARSTMRGPR